MTQAGSLLAIIANTGKAISTDLIHTSLPLVDIRGPWHTGSLLGTFSTNPCQLALGKALVLKGN